MNLRNALVLAVVLCLTLGFATESFAFNGKRSGFILGFGLGLGQTSFGGEDKKVGINTDFKIGHGFSEQLQVYWASKVAWFSVEYPPIYPDTATEDYTIASGSGGVGVSYFLLPTAPTYYITGGIGFSTWTKPFETDDDAQEMEMGLGFFSGIGYEISPHWSVEVNLICGSPGYKSDGHLSVWTIKASFNALAF